MDGSILLQRETTSGAECTSADGAQRETREICALTREKSAKTTKRSAELCWNMKNSFLPSPFPFFSKYIMFCKEK